eukprot:TRINITY_DN6559_c0_g1_i1.p2 TRINITY_DN6559_c0_g1~~TRINITY_DN6559_c0_g1_i1.p2  ORF type:complete len:474 (+),score=176.28 TRINITY_DN6559_c0_g1_i1:95-1516(+)
MFLAFWLFVTLCFLFCYRELLWHGGAGCRNWITQSDFWNKDTPVYNVLKFVFHAEGMLFVILIVCMAADSKQVLKYINEYDWLQGGNQTYLAGFDEEQKVKWHLPALLRWSSLLCPVATLVTAVSVGNHMWRHMKVCDFDPSKGRDWALQVILLPMVYNVMAFKSVIRMWKCFMGDFTATGHIHIFEHQLTGDFESNVEIEYELYEANYRLADMYEAWALLCFGRLTMAYLSNHHGGRILDDNMKPTEERLEPLRGSVLFNTLSQITLLGVWSFVICAIMKGILDFTAPVISMLSQQTGFDGHLHINDLGNSSQTAAPKAPASSGGESYLDSFFDGAGFFTSSIAIYNLLRIEMSAQLRPYLEEAVEPEIRGEPPAKFQPKWKFWGTKILVSIAYFQSIVLSLANSILGILTEPQVKLFYSSLICFELCGIAVLHQGAWVPEDTWYFHADDEEDRERDLERAKKRRSSYGAIP